MNTAFYLALDRLPMSLVAAIEFVGTIGVAVYGLRKKWTPITGQGKDDISAFLHYSGDSESEKEEKIAQTRI